MPRSAADVITTYVEDVWNKGNAELIREICADPVVRHEAKEIVRLTHDQQVARLSDVVGRVKPVFENIIQSSDGTYVTAVFRVTMNVPDRERPDAPPVRKQGCGIEVFKIEDGRIAEVWNHPMMDGGWA